MQKIAEQQLAQVVGGAITSGQDLTMQLMSGNYNAMAGTPGATSHATTATSCFANGGATPPAQTGR